VLAGGTPTVASEPLSAMFSPMAQNSNYATGLLTAQILSKQFMWFFPVLNPYRLLILFIAFIHIVRCLSIYLY